jgi:hypothetical protein
MKKSTKPKVLIAESCKHGCGVSWAAPTKTARDEFKRQHEAAVHGQR